MLENPQLDDNAVTARIKKNRRSEAQPRFRSDTGRRRHPAVAPLLAVIVLWMTVDVVVAVSNDAIDYLDHSQSLVSTGFSNLGWRTAGYPLFLRFVTTTGPLIGLDGLFSIVFVQRLLVLAFELILARMFRWWGVALFGLLFSVGTMVYVDYVLAESLALPLAALAGLAFGAWWTGRSRLAVSGTALLGIVTAMSILRAQYMVLWVAPLFVLVALWVDADRRAFRRFGAAFAVTIGFVAVFYVGVMNENYNEYGVRTPVADDGSLRYFAAWTTLFVVEQIPPSSQELVAIYDGGNPWPRIWELRTIEPPSERADAFGELTSRLIDVSGYSLAELRLRALGGALIGGRYDDMSSIKGFVTDADLSVRLSTTYRSHIVREMGEQAFLDRYNGGREPAFLVTSPAVWFVPEFPRWVIGALWVALLGLALIPWQANRRQYAYIGAAVAPHVLVSAAAAWIVGDGHRLLLPTLVFSVVAVSLTVVARVETWTRHRPAVPTELVVPGDLASISEFVEAVPT